MLIAALFVYIFCFLLFSIKRNTCQASEEIKDAFDKRVLWRPSQSSILSTQRQREEKLMDFHRLCLIFLTCWFLFWVLHFAVGRPSKNIAQHGKIRCFVFFFHLMQCHKIVLDFSIMRNKCALGWSYYRVRFSFWTNEIIHNMILQANTVTRQLVFI